MVKADLNPARLFAELTATPHAYPGNILIGMTKDIWREDSLGVLEWAALRVATVIIVVVVQEMDRHCLVPGPHDGNVHLGNHPVGDLIPPAALQHNLHHDQALACGLPQLWRLCCPEASLHPVAGSAKLVSSSCSLLHEAMRRCHACGPIPAFLRASSFAECSFFPGSRVRRAQTRILPESSPRNCKLPPARGAGFGGAAHLQLGIRRH